MALMRNFFIFGFAFLQAIAGFGQESVALKRNDTLQYLQQVARIGLSMQQVPVYMRLVLSSHTNLVTSSSDTAQQEVEFCIQKEGSYSKFGPVVQLVNDSLALTYNEEIERIFVYPEPQAVLAGMRNIIALAFSKSALTDLAKQYSISVSVPQVGRKVILLKAKTALFSTDLPREEVHLVINSNNDQPIEVNTIRRVLVPLDPEQTAAINKDEQLKKFLVATPDGQHYLVKERNTLFKYQVIDHQVRSLPLKTSDVVQVSAGREIVPTEKFKAFEVISN